MAKRRLLICFSFLYVLFLVQPTRFKIPTNSIEQLNYLEGLQKKTKFIPLKEGMKLAKLSIMMIIRQRKEFN